MQYYVEAVDTNPMNLVSSTASLLYIAQIDFNDQ